MHKRFVNHCTIELIISPSGPILIKAGKEKEGADPTKPDMEFIETFHGGGRSIYLPGSSLKGAIRAHAERIVRTVGKDKRPADTDILWTSDPLSRDKQNNPNYYLEDWKKQTIKHYDPDNPDKEYFDPGPEIYKQSCFISQLFGNTAIASRFRVEDAYPNKSTIKIEERNGVAIDRVFGSAVPGALFNYQVCTAGEFKTKIHLKNFTLAQLGLIGLVLRDLNDGWFGLGFAKSRGMGTVEVKLEKAIVQYPGCVLENEQIKLLGSNQTWPVTQLLGVGEFCSEVASDYSFPTDDKKTTTVNAEAMELGLGVKLTFLGKEKVTELFTRSVEAWKRKVEGVPA